MMSCDILLPVRSVKGNIGSPEAGTSSYYPGAGPAPPANRNNTTYKQTMRQMRGRLGRQPVDVKKMAEEGGQKEVPLLTTSGKLLQLSKLVRR